MTNSSRSKRIAVATGTRADWGLLKPTADELLRRGCDVTVLATNMHLQETYGNTIEEIIADGYNPVRIPSPGLTPAEITASALKGFSEWFHTNVPDTVVILGDRFEMLGVATAALLEGIPVAHIAGGTVSEGAFDDSIRHSITKMATIHFPETELCRGRILQMGENPTDVVTAGATGVWNILNNPLMNKADLERDLGFRFNGKTLMATLHPATLETISPLLQMESFLSALSSLMAEDPEVSVILTYPNNDSNSDEITEAMINFANNHGDRVLLRKSLGRLRYLSALQFCKGVVGNSSSGIVEVPSEGIPTLDIGIRQKGREHGPSVIHCGTSEQEILDGLHYILSEEIQGIAAKRINPYQKDDTPSIIAGTIERYPFLRYPAKRFHSI